MCQAPFLECGSFDPFSLQQDGLAAPEVDVGRCEIAEALVVPVVIIGADELCNLRFKIPGQIIAFEQDAVLERLVPAFDLALRHRMIRRATDMIHVPFREPISEFARNVARTVVRQQAGRCITLASSSPEAASASLSLSVTSAAFIVVHSFQATM